MNLRAVALSAALASSTLALSGALAAPPGPPVPPVPAQDAQPIAVRAARMLDVAAGRMIEPGLVVVRGERIVSVGGEVPEGARVVDLGDATLLPGLIDLHTHLSGQIDERAFVREVTETELDAAYRAQDNGRKTLLAGFTTVRDFGGEVTVALGKAVERGLVVSPWIFPSRYALGVTGGHCDTTGFIPGVLERDWRTGIADGVDEVVKAVRYQIKHGAKVIKTCATAGVLSFEEQVGAQQYSDAELEAMVQEASRHGVPVAAHAHGTEGIRAAVRAGVTSIEHGSILDRETIELMKERGTYLVPTTYLAEAIDFDVLPPPIRAKAEEILPLARESLAEAIASGVSIAFGTDAAVYPHGDNAREFAVLVKLGMDSLEALRAATVRAAAVLGVEDRGVLESGRLADVIAVPGDPLADIEATERVAFVMQGGRIVKGGQ